MDSSEVQQAADERAESVLDMITALDDGCAGLIGGCPDCQQLYLRLTGNQKVPGLCVICSGRHFPWKDHLSAA